MKIYITPQAKAVLDFYIANNKDEVGGLGIAEVVGDNILVTDILLLKQEVSGSETDLDREDIAELMTEMIQDGQDPSCLKVWWHSHANMGAFWSGTDDKTAEGFSNDWMVSIVGNKRGEFRARLDLFKPVYIPLEVTLEIAGTFLSREQQDELLDEIKRKVKTKSWTTTVYGGQAGYQPGQGYGNAGYGAPGYYRGEHGYWRGGEFHPWKDEPKKGEEERKALPASTTADAKSGPVNGTQVKAETVPQSYGAHGLVGMTEEEEEEWLQRQYMMGG